MEALLVVLRPKLLVSATPEFRPEWFDILLTDVRLSSTDKTKTLKHLPKTTVSYEREPTEILFEHLYCLTNGELNAKRAVFVPPARTEVLGAEQRESYLRGSLFCIPVDSRDKLNPNFHVNSQNALAFYSLNVVLESLNNGSLAFAKQTKVMLIRLESWLREKHKVPGAVNLLFSVSTEHRLKLSIKNPAYLADGLSLFQGSERYTRSLANEVLAKMMAIEKCDIAVINPLFGMDMPYKSKVEMCVTNRYWGMGTPDYSKIKLPDDTKKQLEKGQSPNWTEEFPLHKCAYEGDAKGAQELVNKRYPVNKKDRDSWAPIHYAVWHGHLKVIQVLLEQPDCQVNITNDNGSTPLHFAAYRGHPYVVELLLNHSYVDINAVDKKGYTALDLCENVQKPDHQHGAKLLKKAGKRPAPRIQVNLMDGTYRMLSLVSGANTTVQQLHQQMMRELDMPESCGQLFTIWICSVNLQLQLKQDHKPIQHINDWRRKIVKMLTDCNPVVEDEPQLYWRRDAILPIAEERKVRNSTAINLLFHEAYHNYIKSLYPCADQDAVVLGGILMQLNHGDYDSRKCRNFFANERQLKTLIPVAKLRGRNINWTNKIQDSYRQYSSTMSDRDRSPHVLQLHFLTVCWNLTVYGSAFFTGHVQIKSARSPTPVYIGVNDIGVHIIQGTTKKMLQSFSYRDIDWQHRSDKPILELRLKNGERANTSMHIVTKQAGLIFHLMTKLAQLNS